MTDENSDDRGKHGKIARLEQALANETRTSALLRDNLEKLQRKVAEIERSFGRRLEAATKHSERADAKLLDQHARLAALGTGREDTMRALVETRAELDRVKADRNQLQKKLALLDGMQSETIALTEDSNEKAAVHQALPTIDELMASLRFIEEGKIDSRDHSAAVAPPLASTDPGGRDMIAADVIFPEEFASARANDDASHYATRVLVYMDVNPPIKYPISKDVLTIGRSDSADIQVEQDFISRIHARLVSDKYGTVVEDVDSKNGIKVNAKFIERHALRHGDILSLGKLRFMYIETTPEHAG